MGENGELGEHGEHGEHGKDEKHHTLFMIQNTFLTQSTLFVNQMTQNIRFYGSGSKSHNICEWKTWS